MPVKLFVPISGGLLGDQTGAIQRVIEGIGDSVKVWSPQGLNDYDNDFAAAVSIYPTDHIALVGHSFGADAMIYTAEKLVDQGIDFDQVHLIEMVWGTKRPPRVNKSGKPVQVYAYRRSEYFGIPTAKVEGVNIEVIPNTNHNNICRSPVLLEKILNRVRPLAF